MNIEQIITRIEGGRTGLVWGLFGTVVVLSGAWFLLEAVVAGWNNLGNYVYSILGLCFGFVVIGVALALSQDVDNFALKALILIVGCVVGVYGARAIIDGVDILNSEYVQINGVVTFARDVDAGLEDKVVWRKFSPSVPTQETDLSTPDGGQIRVRSELRITLEKDAIGADLASRMSDEEMVRTATAIYQDSLLDVVHTVEPREYFPNHTITGGVRSFVQSDSNWLEHLVGVEMTKRKIPGLEIVVHIRNIDTIVK